MQIFIQKEVKMRYRCHRSVSSACEHPITIASPPSSPLTGNNKRLIIIELDDTSEVVHRSSKKLD